MSDTPIRDAHWLSPGRDGPIRLKFNAFLDEVVAPLERELAEAEAALEANAALAYAPSAARPSEWRWRSHEEKPDTAEPVTALLMIPAVEGAPYPHMIAGIYLWRGGQWVNEDTGRPCSTPFWWALEDEIAATVASPRSATRPNAEERIAALNGQVSALFNALNGILRHCDVAPEGETDFERAVIAARKLIADGPSATADRGSA